MAFINKRSLIALFVSLVLLLSCFTVCAFAEAEADGTTAESTTAEAAESNTEESTESSTETDSSSTNETTSTTEESTTAASSSTTTETKKDHTELIVNLVIGGILIAVGAFLIIKNRVKLAAFLRSVKSEMKKVVWSPKDQTRKNFIVVVIICIIVIIAVAILDFAFGWGIAGLAKLFK